DLGDCREEVGGYYARGVLRKKGRVGPPGLTGSLVERFADGEEELGRLARDLVNPVDAEGEHREYASRNHGFLGRRPAPKCAPPPSAMSCTWEQAAEVKTHPASLAGARTASSIRASSTWHAVSSQKFPAHSLKFGE